MKALILVCLIGYVMSQRVSTNVCPADLIAAGNSSSSSSSRVLQAMKKVCPKNTDSCCPSATLNKMRDDYVDSRKQIQAFFTTLTRVITHIINISSNDSTGYRVAHWKNGTVCKGKRIQPPLTETRRLQSVQQPCRQAQALHDALTEAATALGRNFSQHFTQCFDEISKLRAGVTCTVCNKVQRSNVDMSKKELFIDHKPVETMIRGCSDVLTALRVTNKVVNKLHDMLPASRRRLQAVVSNTDYIGFPIESCTKYWTGRRLQALKKDSVQSHPECADLGLWMANGMVLRAGPWPVNPSIMKVVKDYTNAIGTQKAKDEWKTIEGGNNTAVDHDQDGMTFVFSSNQSGLEFTNFAPNNLEKLTD